MTTSGKRRAVGFAMVGLAAVLAIWLEVTSHSATPRSQGSAVNPPCAATDQLRIQGPFNECVVPAQAIVCTPRASSPKGYYVVRRFHGPRHDFLVYAEVRTYTGPGRFPLAPWPTSSLNVDDGVAKVAVREARSGTLWESNSGVLLIGSAGDAGVLADLTQVDNPQGPQMSLEGSWRCA